MLDLSAFIEHWEQQQRVGSTGSSPRYAKQNVGRAIDAIAWAREIVDWPPSSVLEIGCCDGAVLHLFKEAGVCHDGLFGMTLFKAEATACKKQHGYTVFVESMHRTKLADNQFEVVFSQRTLEHSPVAFFALYQTLRLASKWALIGLPQWPRQVTMSRHYAVLPAENVWNWIGKLGGVKLGQMEKDKSVWFLVDSTAISLWEAPSG